MFGCESAALLARVAALYDAVMSATETAPETAPEVAPAAPATPPSMAPAVESDFNRLGLDYAAAWPRPPVEGAVVDFHCHLLNARHADAWFAAADHYGIDFFCTMSPLDEAVRLVRRWGDRLHLIAVPNWWEDRPDWLDRYRRHLDGFHHLGSRVFKFHLAPGSIRKRGGTDLDSPEMRRVVREATDRGMIVMTHVGDPETWYQGKYAAEPDAYAPREAHYAMWERALEAFRGHPWVGAHLGGNPEDLARLQRLLDRFPDLWLDLSATRWQVREVSRRREAAREFIVRNADRLLWGSDQVSGDDRGFDFYASRFWAHRKLWETAYAGESPISDPDVPAGEAPQLRGLALPDGVLQKIYHDNAVRLLGSVGVRPGGRN